MHTIKIVGMIGDPPAELRRNLREEGITTFTTENEVANEILSLPDDREDLQVIVHSIGGDVSEGFGIADLIAEEGKKRKIITVGVGYDSIASIIFLQGAERKHVEGASPLIHNAWLSAKELGDMTLNQQSISELAEAHGEMNDMMAMEYAKVAGRDKLPLIRKLMENETCLTEEQVERLNFATEVISEEEVNSGVSLRKAAARRGCAYKGGCLKNKIEKSKQNRNFTTTTKKTKKKTDMSEQLSEKVSAMDKALRGLKAMFVKNMKAMTLPLAGEDAGQLFVFTDEDEIQGKEVVVADEGGEPTEEAAPDGSHQLEDGRTVTVEGGVITNVAEASGAGGGGGDDDMTALKEELAQAKKEMEAAKEEMEAAKKDKEKAQKEASESAKAVKLTQSKFTELEEQFKALKKDVPGQSAGPSGSQGGSTFSDEEWEKLSKSQRLKYQAMAQAKQTK